MPTTTLMPLCTAIGLLAPDEAARRAMDAHRAALAPLLPFASSLATLAPRGPAAAAFGPHAPALLHFARAIMTDARPAPPLPVICPPFTEDPEHG